MWFMKMMFINKNGRRYLIKNLFEKEKYFYLNIKWIFFLIIRWSKYFYLKVGNIC